MSVQSRKRNTVVCVCVCVASSLSSCVYTRAGRGHGVSAFAVSSVTMKLAREIMLTREKRDTQIAAQAGACPIRHEQRTQCRRVRCTTMSVLQKLPSTGSLRERCAVRSSSSLMHEETRTARKVQPCEMRNSRCACHPRIRT